MLHSVHCVITQSEVWESVMKVKKFTRSKFTDDLFKRFDKHLLSSSVIIKIKYIKYKNWNKL